MAGVIRPCEDPLLAVLDLYWKISCSLCNFSCVLASSVVLNRRGGRSNLLATDEADMRSWCLDSSPAYE
jgi:hypothetical protein